jgi:uncharacterized protein
MPSLSRLDRAMAATYTRLRQTLPAFRAEQLRQDQRGFLQGRDACGANVACIDTAYRFQLDRMVIYE